MEFCKNVCDINIEFTTFKACTVVPAISSVKSVIIMPLFSRLRLSFGKTARFSADLALFRSMFKGEKKSVPIEPRRNRAWQDCLRTSTDDY